MGIVKPDIQFIRDVVASGGETLKKCYQCATCSVTCNLAPDDRPFPRKEMIQAQWGLRNKLMANPDIWLCHQCSDCTVYCPRGARPGEVLGAIRRLVISHYSRPRLLSRVVSQPRYLMFLIAAPILILLAVLALSGNLRIPEGKIIYDHFMPARLIYLVYFPAAAFSLLSLGVGILRYWSDMECMSPPSNPKTSFFLAALTTFIEILSHSRFRKCELNRPRSVAHLLIFYGFIGLGLTAALGAFYLYALGKPSPYSFTDPLGLLLKLVGNTSAGALFIGLILVICQRFKDKAGVGIGGYFDWLLIVVLFIVMITGVFTQLARLADVAHLAYPIYFLHLSSVLFLFLYAPFSKMAHVAYRTVALIHARHVQREGEALRK